MIKEEIIFAEKPTKKWFKDLEGQSFGRLRVIGFAGIYGKGKTNYSHWWVECDCGTIKSVMTRTLLNGCAVSCGCYSKEVHSTHGMTGSSELSSFMCAKNRCNNPNDKEYHNYGERGIQFRLTSITEVIESIGLKPEPKYQYSIERIDTNGHYEIGNIKWATMREQQRNRRNNHNLTYNNETKCLSEWSREYSISMKTLLRRLQKGWCESCSLTTPLNPKGKRVDFNCPHK